MWTARNTRAELGWVLDPARTGRGHATEERIAAATADEDVAAGFAEQPIVPRAAEYEVVPTEGDHDVVPAERADLRRQLR